MANTSISDNLVKDETININGIDYIELQDNVNAEDSITINGKKYIPFVYEDRLPQFQLVFDRKDGCFCKGSPEIESDDNSVTFDKKRIYLDIYPLLVEKFGEEEAQNALQNFIGVKYETKNAGDTKIVFQKGDFDSMMKEFEDLVSATFTNQKQAIGFNTTADRIFNRRFNSIFDPFGFLN